jgi:hypothetical protein
MAMRKSAIAREKYEKFWLVRAARCSLLDIACLHDEAPVHVSDRLPNRVVLAVDLKRVDAIALPQSHHDSTGQRRLRFGIDDPSSIWPSRMAEIPIPTLGHLLLG